MANEVLKQKHWNLSVIHAFAAVAALGAFGATLGMFLTSKSTNDAMQGPFYNRVQVCDDFNDIYCLTSRFYGDIMLVGLFYPMAFALLFLTHSAVWLHLRSRYEDEAAAGKSYEGFWSRIFEYTYFADKFHYFPIEYIGNGGALVLTDVAVFYALKMNLAEFIFPAIGSTAMIIVTLPMFEYFVKCHLLSGQGNTTYFYISVSVILFMQIALYWPWITLFSMMPVFTLENVSSFYYTLLSFQFIWTALYTVVPLLTTMGLVWYKRAGMTEGWTYTWASLLAFFPMIVMSILFTMQYYVGQHGFITDPLGDIGSTTSWI
jgi:hypothetical protein